mmetsp:Transcript_39550/g.45186  ORF Transcript_39550/g.45186 Transcript_39550/m.45186 type:complete len:182 (+) Transcript_39550:104-649(+)
MNNNKTIEALSEAIVMKMKEEEEEKAIAIAMKMARELAAERKKKKNGELLEAQQQQRKIEITKLLQQCGTSMSSLQSLSIKESRHIENCQAIPEGNEHEEEDDDDDDVDDDSIVQSVSRTSTDLVNGSDSNSNTDCNCSSDIEKGIVKQIEQQRRRRNSVFHRMKQRFVVAKSVVVAAKSA